MSKIITLVLFLVIITQTELLAQKKDNYTCIVREEIADINADKKIDCIIVKMDTIDATRPLRLEIHLSQPNGKLKLQVSTNKLLEPMYPKEKNGEYCGYQIPQFTFEDDMLKMWREIENGNITYEFRYNKQKTSFELINVIKLTKKTTNNTIDENTIFSEVNFNLRTGIRTEVTDSWKSGELSNTKTKKIINPLPLIENMHYSDWKLY